MIAKLWWTLIRFGFRLLYNELAFTYDLVSWVVSFGQWRVWQRVALRYLDAASSDLVLELAHGTGNLQIDMRERGYQTVGLDLSPQMGRIARRKLVREGWHPKLTRGSALALPFPDETYACVISTFPTPFIFRQETIAEAHRVLKPGGRLVIGANARITGSDPLARLLELAYIITGQRGDLPLDAIAQRFVLAGFSVEFVSRQIAGGEVWIMVADK